MKQTVLRQEIRKMKLEEIIEMRTEKRLTTQEAAQLLGMSDRNLRRYLQRYETEGLAGLTDGRLGKAAHNAADAEEVNALVELYQQHYSGYTASHFFDKYRGKYRGQRSYNWVRLRLQETACLHPKKRRGPHRRRRPRTPMKGMMLHQDGSTHEWIAGVYWDLIATLDDADNEIYSLFFVEEEGTWSSFQGVKEVIEQQGLFCSLYTDRGSHYWHTAQAGKRVDQSTLTQFGRAMQQLGIEMIPAYSPEARGRSERMFGTLQGRLPNELKSAGITTLDEANQFLQSTFLPEFNQRFKVEAQEEEDAFVPWSISHLTLDDVLCLQEQRTVNKDNTVSYRGKPWQLPKDPMRYSYAKAKVKVHEYADGSIAIFHGPRKLVHFDREKEGVVEKPIERSQREKTCGLREFMDNRKAVTHKPHEGPQVQQQI